MNTISSLKLADEIKARAILYGVKRAATQLQISTYVVYQRLHRAGLTVKAKKETK